MKGEQLRDIEPYVKVWYVTRNWGEPPFSRSLGDDPRLLLYAFLSGIKLLAKLLILHLKGIFDVISVHCSLEAFLMRLSNWFLRTPYVFVFEGYTYMEGRLAKKADLQIALSPTVARNCVRNHGYRPLIIPVGVDLSRFKKIRRTNPLEAKGKNVVLTVGRLGPEKNLPTLIRAAHIISQKESKFLFVIVGEGSEKERLKRMINDLQLNQTVILIGMVNDAELPSYYRFADIFVSPQDIAITGDQFLIVFLEAMTSGLPIIWTSAETDFEGVEDWGVVVPPKRPGLLAEAILKLTHDHHTLQKLAENGRVKVRKYDWDTLIERYEKAYMSVVRKRRG